MFYSYIFNVTYAFYVCMVEKLYNNMELHLSSQLHQ